MVCFGRNRSVATLIFQNLRNPRKQKCSIAPIQTKSQQTSPSLYHYQWTIPNSTPASVDPLFFSPGFFRMESPKTLHPTFLRQYSNCTANNRSRSLLPQIPAFLDYIRTPIIHPDARRFSTSSPEEPQPELRHQEITGPTVKRDLSPLASETREVLDLLQKSMYHLSSVLALLGLSQLGLGAWIAYSMRPQPPAEVVVQGLAAFAFPFSLAFLLRRTLKPLSFFQKMEEQGRLQILTLALQASKSVRLFFLRARVVCIGCVVCVATGSLITLWVD
ncbi:hypothetical protein HPP92_022528 [Vanilla planifolia]|uniref:Uncharacterized protein n=1 Tax=Vanilla planifolia TaxID=51239 RepID=A0A835UFR3_VANPL|nr:hypothetical protein HPP92_022528 [Vanilla planifolia]